MALSAVIRILWNEILKKDLLLGTLFGKGGYFQAFSADTHRAKHASSPNFGAHRVTSKMKRKSFVKENRGRCRDESCAESASEGGIPELTRDTDDLPIPTRPPVRLSRPAALPPPFLNPQGA